MVEDIVTETTPNQEVNVVVINDPADPVRIFAFEICISSFICCLDYVFTVLLMKCNSLQTSKMKPSEDKR